MTTRSISPRPNLQRPRSLPFTRPPGRSARGPALLLARRDVRPRRLAASGEDGPVVLAELLVAPRRPPRPPEAQPQLPRPHRESPRHRAHRRVQVREMLRRRPRPVQRPGELLRRKGFEVLRHLVLRLQEREADGGEGRGSWAWTALEAGRIWGPNIEVGGASSAEWWTSGDRGLPCPQLDVPAARSPLAPDPQHRRRRRAAVSLSVAFACAAGLRISTRGLGRLGS